jgi:predicted RNase H-like HicB family nuclease
MPPAFTVVLARGADGWYTAVCPSLPGAVAEGPTREAALADAAAAASAWLETAAANGRVPLAETPDLVAAAVADALRDLAAEGAPLVVETAVIAAPSATAA